MPLDVQIAFIFGAEMEKKCDMVLFNTSVDDLKADDCAYDPENLTDKMTHDDSQDWLCDV